MRRIVLFVAGVCFAVALGVSMPKLAAALSANTASTEFSGYEQPAPLAAKHPIKVALPGAANACTTFTPGGVNLRVSCTVDCAYDVGQSLPDAGVQISAGVYAATADSNQLPAATPETLALPPKFDSVCVYSATAGSAYVAARYP